jgi:hypothetical protein
MLGQRLVTHQTGPEGLPISIVYVEAGSSIERELYLSLLVDRGRERIVVMASAAGGMDIEEVAAKTPEKILTVYVHPAAGLQAYQARQLAFGLELKGDQVGQFTKLLQNLYRLFVERDCGLLEVNPLIVNGEGKLHALDAKIGIEENALFRQSRLMEWRDPSQEDEMENRASAHGLNYVSLDGEIACMVNGAGLAMATMDLIKLHGGAPANFLDVGGGATAERVSEAFKLILSNANVEGDPGEHLRRHRPLRPDRRGHHPGGQGGGRQGAGGGAPRGHQRGARPRAAREQRRGHHRGRGPDRRGPQGRRGGRQARRITAHLPREEDSMSILVDRNSKVICQGFTGRQGSFHSEQCIEYGTQMVGGVTPGRGGEKHLGLPVFDTVHDAVAEAGADVSMIYVPAPYAADAILEAGRRRHQARGVHHRGHPGARHGQGQGRAQGLRLPPDRPELPRHHHAGRGEDRHHARLHPQARQGRHRVALRHAHLRGGLPDDPNGLGQSTCVGIGGDPVRGMNFIDCLELFEQDEQTEGVLMVGEIGGSDEEAAAEYIAAHMTKPVVAYIAGVTAPPGKRMGHAGAIVSGGKGTATRSSARSRAPA